MKSVILFLSALSLLSISGILLNEDNRATKLVNFSESIKEKTERYTEPALQFKYIDSIIAVDNHTQEQRYYLSNLKQFINPSLSLNKKQKFFHQKIEANEFSEKNEWLKYHTRFLLSKILQEKKEYHLALKELQAAISYLNQDLKHNIRYIAEAYKNISFINGSILQDSEAAKKTAYQAKELYERIEDYKMAQISLHMLGNIEFENKNFYLQKTYAQLAIQSHHTHTPTDFTIAWKRHYPLLLLAHAKMDEVDSVKHIYHEAERVFKQGNISELTYNIFTIHVLESLIDMGLLEAYEYQYERLGSLIKDDVELQTRFLLNKYYAAGAKYYRRTNPKKEREVQIIRFENAYKGKITGYFLDEVQKILKRLIELDERDQDIKSLNKWYKKQLELNKLIEDQKYVQLQQQQKRTKLEKLDAEKNLSSETENDSQARSFLSVILGLTLTLAIVSTLFIRKSNRDSKDKKEKGGRSPDVLLKDIEELKRTNANLAAELKKKLLMVNDFFKTFEMSIELIKKETEIGSQVKKTLLELLESKHNKKIINEIDFQSLSRYDAFYKKLSKSFPQLTRNNLKLCTYLKMNLSTKEIASLEFTSLGSVKVAKSRLRKKLELTENHGSLEAYLNTI